MKENLKPCVYKLWKFFKMCIRDSFGTDTNVVTLITADDCTELEIMDKSCVAARSRDRLLKM